MKIRSDFLNTPAAAQLAGNNAANTMSNFASLLQQQSRAPALAPAAAPVVAAPPKAAPAAPETSNAERSAPGGGSEPTEAADEASAEESPNKPRAANKSRPRQLDAKASARPAREGAAPTRNENKTTAPADETAAAPADSKAQSDAAPAAWLAGWMAAPGTTPPSAAAGVSRSTGPGEPADGTDALPGDPDATGTLPGATRGRGAPAGARKADAREALDAAASDRSSASNLKEPASSLPGFAAVLAEQRHAEAAPQRDASLPSFEGAHAAAAAGSSPAGNVSQDAAGTSAAQVRAAVGSPEFPQELGVQLSVLARDGIQHAELHLNPADMGPVSVQIVMDGTQARIDFGADVAATRHAIEAGLPELASALRDAGFTLAGGGVSQHAGGRQGSEGDGTRRDGAASRSIAAAGDGENAPRVVRTRVSAGGVDLYA